MEAQGFGITLERDVMPGHPCCDWCLATGGALDRYNVNIRDYRNHGESNGKEHGNRNAS